MTRKGKKIKQRRVPEKRKNFTKAERHIIFRRDNYTCQLCDKDLSDLPEERVLDHKIPLSKFGSNNLRNIWLLCDDCDKAKKSSVIPEAIQSRIDEIQEKRLRRKRNFFNK